MLGMFKSVILCNIMIYVANAAVMILPPQKKPPELACEEGCYVPDLDVVLPYDEPYSPQDGETCLQYLCKTNNITLIETCGVIGIADDCRRISGDKFLPYPDCCDTVQCPL